MKKVIGIFALALLGAILAFFAFFDSSDDVDESNVILCDTIPVDTMFFLPVASDSVEYAIINHYGHNCVDLGLTSGTLWATCNIGAENPEDCGDYYAWGETETHYYVEDDSSIIVWKDGYSDGYNWGNYKYCNGSDTALTKYVLNDDAYFCGMRGFYDDKAKLENADDVAVRKWRGKWEMPTNAQQVELINECYWVWTTSYNCKPVNGYIVFKAKSIDDKAKKVYSGYKMSADYSIAKDAHIFLPIAGFRVDTSLQYVDDYGLYWSRSLCESPNYAYVMNLNSGAVIMDRVNRCYGRSVRAVVKD